MSTSPLNTPPDVDMLFTRFPVFQVVDGGLVTMIICEMVDQIGDARRWCGNSYNSAILYLTAHALTMQGEPERSIANAKQNGEDIEGVVQTGAVTQVKVGDVETRFDSNTGPRGQLDAQSLRNLSGDQVDYSLTHYGRQYLKLRQKNFGGPRVFACT